MPLHITLISRSPSLCNAWRTSISKHLPPPSNTVELAILQNTLKDTNGKLTCDCIPPGSCTIVPLSPQFSSNQWNASSIAVLPTMPVPRKVDWNKDLVYNTTWALLVSIDRWNTTRSNRIEKILLPGLGTGTGGSVLRDAQNRWF